MSPRVARGHIDCYVFTVLTRKRGTKDRVRVARLTQLSRCAGTLALVAAPLVACGARTWLPAGQTDQQTDHAEPCTGTPVAVVPNVPNLYFVLDASGSMLQNSKWENVRSAVGGLIRELGQNARFGATVFPTPSIGACSTGTEVMALRLGDPAGQAEAAFLAATAIVPNGGTPTAATFRSLMGKVTSFRGTTSVILATDGGPNCDTQITACGIDQCTSNTDGVPINATQSCSAGAAPNCCDPNDPTVRGSPLGCLDGDATAQAIGDLQAVGVQTYVMGIPGSAPYGPLLDQLASAGGTARTSEPHYYAVDSADTAALGGTLEDIAARALRSCTLVLSQVPADPHKVNVYVDGTVVGSDGPDGWSLNGQVVTLEGAACGHVQSDAPLPMVSVVQGCPTVP